MNTGEDKNRSFPLSATLAGVSDQTRAQIEYYIERGKSSVFSMARSFDKPDVVIMDYDHPGTAQRLAEGEWRNDVIKLLLASGAPQVHGAVRIPKPLTTAGLEKAAGIALQQLNGEWVADADNLESVDETTPISATSGAPVSADVNPSPTRLTHRTGSLHPDEMETPAYFRTSDAALPGPASLSMATRIQRYQDKINLLCGPPRTLEQLSDPQNIEHRYDPYQCLSSRVAQIIFEPDPATRAVHIRLPEAEVYVLPTLNKVYTSLSLEYKRNVALLFSDWDDADIKVREYDADNVNDIIDTLNQSTRYGFSAQSFCWLSSLFSARGRLPLGVDIDVPCKLLHWPNMTRLELIPDSMEIAAAWTAEVASLRQIVERVQCETRHAVSFFNAASTIKLLVGANDNGR